MFKLVLYALVGTEVHVKFTDEDGNILVPKSVRPIIGLDRTFVGSKRGATAQYRYGRLHVREYESHYTVHMDSVDPLKDPLGHLVIDAPEYLAGAAAAVAVGRSVFRKSISAGKPGRTAALDAIIAGCVAGSAAGKFARDAACSLKKQRG